MSQEDIAKLFSSRIKDAVSALRNFKLNGDREQRAGCAVVYKKDIDHVIWILTGNAEGENDMSVMRDDSEKYVPEAPDLPLRLPVNGSPTGWICPKCGSVMAPHVGLCPHCSRPPFSSIPGTSIPPYTGTPQIFCQCGRTRPPAVQ